MLITVNNLTFGIWTLTPISPSLFGLRCAKQDIHPYEETRWDIKALHSFKCKVATIQSLSQYRLHHRLRSRLNSVCKYILFIILPLHLLFCRYSSHCVARWGTIRISRFNSMTLNSLKTSSFLVPASMKSLKFSLFTAGIYRNSYSRNHPLSRSSH